MFCDSELIIQEVKSIYQVKQNRLKLYLNEVWDIIDNYFLAFSNTYVLRDCNEKRDSLALVASCFKVPTQPHLRYVVEFIHKPVVPNNIKRYKFFEDDEKINRFLKSIGDFSGSLIDEEDEIEEFQNPDVSNSIIVHDVIELKRNFFLKV